MRRKRKVYALFGAEPGVSEPPAGESKLPDPWKGDAQNFLGGTVGKWGLQGNATKTTLQGDLGMEARNGG